MSKKLNDELLRRAAQRASHRTSFVASALSAYQAQEKIGEEQLAVFLDCSPQDLSKLALCRRPNSSASSFRSEVTQIAEYAGVNAFRLAQLFRKVESITALRNVPSSHKNFSSRAFLIAARDRMEDETSINQASTENTDLEPDET